MLLLARVLLPGVSLFPVVLGNLGLLLTLVRLTGIRLIPVVLVSLVVLLGGRGKRKEEVKEATENLMGWQHSYC